MTSKKNTARLLIAGFMVMIVLMVVMAVGAVREIGTMAELTLKMYRHPFTVSNAVLKANANIISMHRHMKDVVLARNAADLELAISRVDNDEKEVYRHFDTTMDYFLGDKSMVETARQIFSDWKAIRSEVIELALVGKYDQAATITQGKGADYIALLATHMNGLIGFAGDKAAEFLAYSESEHNRSETIMFGLLLVVVVTGGIIAGFVLFKVTRTEKELYEARRHLEKRVEERTQELSKLSRAVEQSPATVVITDPSGAIEYVNPKFCESSGYTREEVIGENPRFLKSGKTSKEEYRQMWETVLAGDEWHGDFLNKRKDGSEYWESVSISQIMGCNGEITHLVCVKEDITERKRSEVQIKEAKEKAESATRAKATFLAVMSHEIRTPMNGIIGMIDLLRETRLDADQKQMMRTVRDSAFSLLQIINDILDFSKIEAGKLELEAIPVSVRDVMEVVGETLLPNAAKKNLELVTFIDPEIPSRVLGDHVRLRQILFNLAGNSIKFTENTDDRKGRVVLRAERVADFGEDKVGVRFSVEDNGIGMTPKQTTKLFQPFSQAKASTTRRFGGTGLGLSICKTLSDMMGGEISVDSEPGKGAVFTIKLPFGTAPEADDYEDETVLDGLKILLAIEHDDSHAIAKCYLSKWKTKIETVADLDKAVSLLTAAAEADKPFDIFIIGSQLDVDAQKAACDRLREIEAIKGIRFVVLTADRKAKKGMLLPDKVVVEDLPLRRSSFVNGVAMAAGRARPLIEGEWVVGKAKAPTVDEAMAQGRLILVAEDNVTNQDVIRRQLNILGYACDIADDGRQALEMLQEKNYAILLTDCHMPHMDGYELTGWVRKMEKDEEEDKRLPIVAITASVLQGEADLCIEAGMDCCLRKPLEVAKLEMLLTKWMPAMDNFNAPAVSVEVAELKEETAAAIDPRALKDVFGDDDETFKEILQDFVEPSKAIVKDIEDAFNDKKAEDIGAAAHKLKSSARSAGANELADLCSELEKAGKGGDMGTIETLYPSLAELMDAVVEYIEVL